MYKLKCLIHKIKISLGQTIMTTFMKVKFRVSPSDLNRLKRNSVFLLFIGTIKLEINLLIQMDVYVFE